jgi:hypothetical protein
VNRHEACIRRAHQRRGGKLRRRVDSPLGATNRWFALVLSKRRTTILLRLGGRGSLNARSEVSAATSAVQRITSGRVTPAAGEQQPHVRDVLVLDCPVNFQRGLFFLDSFKIVYKSFNAAPDRFICTRNAPRSGLGRVERLISERHEPPAPNRHVPRTMRLNFVSPVDCLVNCFTRKHATVSFG